MERRDERLGATKVDENWEEERGGGGDGENGDLLGRKMKRETILMNITNTNPKGKKEKKKRVGEMENGCQVERRMKSMKSQRVFERRV